MAVCKSGSRLLPDTESISTFLLDSGASKNVRNKYLMCKAPSCDILLWQFGLTETLLMSSVYLWGVPSFITTSPGQIESWVFISQGLAANDSVNEASFC